LRRVIVIHNTSRQPIRLISLSGSQSTGCPKVKTVFSGVGRAGALAADSWRGLHCVHSPITSVKVIRHVCLHSSRRSCLARFYWCPNGQRCVERVASVGARGHVRRLVLESFEEQLATSTQIANSVERPRLRALLSPARTSARSLRGSSRRTRTNVRFSEISLRKPLIS